MGIELISGGAAAFLNLRRLPARCDARQAAAILGVNEDHIPILVKTGMLSPLGDPIPNSPKFFFTEGLLEKARDEKWLSRASNCVSAIFVKRKNGSALTLILARSQKKRRLKFERPRPPSFP